MTSMHVLHSSWIAVYVQTVMGRHYFTDWTEPIALYAVHSAYTLETYLRTIAETLSVKMSSVLW